MKYTLLFTALLSITYANAASLNSETIVKNTHGVVDAGTWVSMALENGLTAKQGAQKYSARTLDPIYNKKMTEILIPQGATISGTYNNDGKTCSLSVDTISFKGTDISLKPGAYSEVNLSQLNHIGCNVSTDYPENQLMEFQFKVDIKTLDVIKTVKNAINPTDNNYVQSYGDSDYKIRDITNFTNGLMQVTVVMNKDELNSNNLVPVYFDDLGMAHNLNYYAVPLGDNVYAYEMLSHYDKWGFGVME